MGLILMWGWGMTAILESNSAVVQNLCMSDSTSFRIFSDEKGRKADFVTCDIILFYPLNVPYMYTYFGQMEGLKVNLTR